MKSKIAYLLVMSAGLWATPTSGQQPLQYPAAGAYPGVGTPRTVQGAQPVRGYPAAGHSGQGLFPRARPSGPPVGVSYSGGPVGKVAPAAQRAPTPLVRPVGGAQQSAMAINGVPAGSYQTTPVYTEDSMPEAIAQEAELQPIEGCEGCAGSTACDACGDCGLPSCDCGCGHGILTGMLAGHGLGGGLFHNGGPARPARIWGGVEFLYMWNKDRNLPVLATTSPAGTSIDDAGVLGATGTSVLFGGGEFDADPEGGIRGTLGVWLDRHQTLGVVGRAFSLGPEDIDYQMASTGSPILARPFFDADLGVQDALVVAFPGSSRGRIDIQTENEITGFDVMLRKMLYYGNCNRIDVVGGYHHTEIMDVVRAGHFLVSEDPNGRVPLGTRIETTDIFRADNEFHGGSIGVMAQGYDGKLTWNLLTKISFGNTQESVTIRGTSTSTVPGGGSATSNQGLLALNTNSGVYERDEFTIVPEADLSVAYNLSSSLQLSVGYSLIYWSNAILAGDAIDTGINPTQIDGGLIGVARPSFTLDDDESFWAHGLTFGVSGRF